jgi:hypothetical protein
MAQYNADYRNLDLWIRIPESINVRKCVSLDARCVYRHYDGDERLLYVGCTMEPVTRAQSHRHGSLFVEFIEITIELWYPDAETAFTAEREAIKTESPVFNTSGRPAAVSEWLQSEYLSKYQRGYRRDL